jgi:arylsulfatase A-like enzyme
VTSPLAQQTSRRFGVLAAACAVGLLAGLLDVSVALLNKPRDLSRLAAFQLPLLAVAASFGASLLALWALVKPLAARASLRLDAAFAGLAGFLFAFLALTLLAGLHTEPPSAHTVFRTGIIAAMSAAFGLGAFSIRAAVNEPRHVERGAALLLAAPIVMFELLVYEWLQVYAIDDVVSLASALVSAAFLLVGAVTIAVYARMRAATAARVLAAFVGLLGAAPAAAAFLPSRGGEVRADVSSQPGAPRQVILVTVDTLRWDAVSAYGHGTLTPAIDRLAADAVVFDNAWSTAPWTLPALGSMLSGLSPDVHGVTGLTSRLPDRVTTVAETLSGYGYRTAAIVHNPLLEPARNFAQGFGEYVDLHEPSYGGSLGARLLQSLGTGGVPPPTWPTTVDLTDVAAEWLAANRNERFFLWLHYFDPHAPYAPPPAYLPAQPPAGMGMRFDEQTALSRGIVVPPPETRRWIRELYDAEVRDVDANVGRLLDALQQLGLYDDALILLSSDHGEEFWEHGSQGHGQSLHPELLRVPLIVKLPGLAAHRRVSAPVTTMSVAPTILELCRIAVRANDLSAPGLEPLTRPEPSAVSLPPVVSGVVWTEGPFVGEQQAVGFDDFRYITAQIAGEEELFDRRIDPGEQRSVAGTAPGPVETARRLLAENARQARALRSRLQIEATELGLDDATLRRLRTLGYVR